jgi:hypothetical protein
MKIAAAENVLFRVFGDEAVLLHLDTEQYYSLNDTGVRIWQLLDEGHSVDETCARMVEEFAVEDAVIRADVLALIEELKAADLIEIRD